jgi:hypothetical protein
MYEQDKVLDNEEETDCLMSSLMVQRQDRVYLIAP